MILEVSELKKHFRHRLIGGSILKALDGVDLSIGRGSTLGVLGPSGCGKTTLARTVTRLLRPTAGRIVFEGEDITLSTGRELREMGMGMQLVFQNPEASFDPRMRLERSLAAPLVFHQGLRPEEAARMVEEHLELVHLDPEVLGRYPHQLSGGQLQRAALARVLSLRPRLIVADEPTAMLDSLVQAQVLKLMKELQRRTGISYLFISHDEKVVDWMSHEVIEMKEGRIVNRREGECP
ncbi:MAG: ABC transporter ATP-binding protein [Methanomassiliicoccales archaeon]|nr:ABC transporter ATP-binding protein [Methanomassiliicoccales archaeon]